MSWQNALLGEHVEVISGPAFKSAYFSNDPDDVPLVKGENIGQGQILWEKSKYWSRADLDSYEKFLLKPGDVIVAMDRPWVPAGLKWASIQPHDPPALLVQRVARLRAQNGLRQDFLKYIIASREFTKYVNTIMYGVNVPHISGGQIRSFSFLLPSEREQECIADILSTYDDLIENNRRRIALLERAAREIYREWFVRLRFPGHEHTKIVDGVPEGWERKRLGEVAAANAQNYQAKELPDVLNYIDISSVSEGRIVEKKQMESGEAPGRARRKAEHGDVIWSNVRPNLRAYSLVLNPEENDVFSTGFTVLSAAGVPFTFLYHHITTDQFVSYLVNQTTGASYPAVRPDDFERAEILVPTTSLLDEFHGSCESNYELIAQLVTQNKMLVQARDLLLPRLMNGSLSV